MSHSAGLTRDGSAGNQFTGLRPFLDKAELLSDLAKPPVLDRNTRFKYSNHGFALLGLVIEAVANEPYAAWIRREVVAPFGLTETEPDMPLPPGAPFARGHTGKALLGRPQLVPGDYPLNALTPAAGFVSTAADLARFFAQLSPNAAASPLSPDSRREMTRGQWKNPDSTLVTTYGLGASSGALGDWNWFGHSGGLLGYISRTAVVPERNLAIAVLTNASNGLAWPWLDGMLHVARALAQKGKPTEDVLGWTGRWWNAWGALDLLPAGNRVLIAAPGFLNPVMDAAEIEVTGPNDGRVALAAGYDGHGEPVRLVRDETGTPIEFWNSGRPLRSRGRGCEGNARPLRPTRRFVIAGCGVVVVAEAVAIINAMTALGASPAPQGDRCRGALDRGCAKEWGAVSEVIPPTSCFSVPARLPKDSPTCRPSRVALTQKLRRLMDDGVTLGLVAATSKRAREAAMSIPISIFEGTLRQISPPRA